MGNLLRRCVEVRTAIELSSGVVSGVGPGIHVLDGSPRASRGSWLFPAWFPAFFGICVLSFTIGKDVQIDDRLVCEKLTIFPYADYIVEFCVELIFL